MLDGIVSAIQEAEIQGLLVKTQKDILSGYSGKKLVGMLQRLSSLFADDAESCYLEIGVFQGLTLLSVAMSCKSIPCYGIDNFAYFDPEEKNFELVKERMNSLRLLNAHVINKDYEEALENLSSEIGQKKIAVYFIDGPHDYRSQLMCLELALPYLHENAVIVIDDCNYRHVRQANRDFLVTHQEYKLIFEAYTACHPKNMPKDKENEAREGWWNGVNVLVKDTNNNLPRHYPPTEKSRKLYENEHLVHSSRLAEFADQAINLLQYFDEFKIFSGFRQLVQTLILVKKNKQTKIRFKSMNTYSKDLTNFNLISKNNLS